MLVEGLIPPGGKLNERTLCEELNISRTPLREAINHGLQTYRNHRDSFRGLQRRAMDQDLSWDNAAKLYEDILVEAKYQW